MAKYKKPSRSKQAKSTLAQQRRREDQLYKQRQRAANTRDKRYLAQLRKLEKTGLYTPKSQRLTPYRKGRINRLAKEYSEYLKPKAFFFIPINRNRKRLLAHAESIGIKTTPIGAFIPHNGHTSARLRKSTTKGGEWEIVRQGKTKRGPNAGRIYKDVIALEPLDTLATEKDRLRRLGASLGPIGKGDRLAFRIIDDSGEGMSHNTYTTVDLLLTALQPYLKDRSKGAGIYMLRHIIIEKSSVIEWRKEAERKGLGAFYKKRKRKTRRDKNQGR